MRVRLHMYVCVCCSCGGREVWGFEKGNYPFSCTSHMLPACINLVSAVPIMGKQGHGTHALLPVSFSPTPAFGKAVTWQNQCPAAADSSAPRGWGHRHAPYVSEPCAAQALRAQTRGKPVSQRGAW